MRRWLTVLLAALVLASLGCGGSSKDQGINNNKDKPRLSSDKAE